MVSATTKNHQTPHFTKTKQTGHGWVNEQNKTISPQEFHLLLKRASGVTINGTYYPRLKTEKVETPAEDDAFDVRTD